MQTQTVYLISFTDDSTGNLGYGLKDMPKDDKTFSSNDGRLIAHDILEHINGPQYIGGIDDELQALGAAWYIRGQNGGFNKTGHYTDPREGLSYDIISLFRDWYYGAEFETSQHADECDADESFSEIIELTKQSAAREIEDDANEDETEQRIGDFMPAAYAKLCEGFNKAAKLYPDSWQVNRLFWRIAETIDKQRTPDFEGKILELTFGINANDEPFARCCEHFEETEFNDE